MSLPIYNPSQHEDKVFFDTRTDFGGQRCVVKPIHIVQYDKSLAVIAVALYKNGATYTLPSAITSMKIRWGKKDHTFVIKDILGVSQDRRTAYFEIDEQMTFFNGPCNPILELRVGDSLIGSASLPFEIDRNPVQEGDLKSANEYVDLEKAVKEVQDARDEIFETLTNYYDKEETDEKIENLENAVDGRISPIEAKIPAQASADNQLADKDFVNSSINSVTAYPIEKDAEGNHFETVAELMAATVFYSGGEVRVPTRNDYTVVRVDEDHDGATTRYYYNNGWRFHYIVNETALTSDQLKALNSGITVELVAKLIGIDMDSKLDKNTGAGRYVYAHNGATQEQLGVAQQTIGANTVPQRTSYGSLRTADPTDSLDAVNKQFYDANKPTLTQLPDGSYSIEFKE